MTVQVKIQGIEKAVRRLDSIQFGRIMYPPMERSVTRLIHDLAIYPAASPTSKYVRTHQLQQHWTRNIIVGTYEIKGEIGNNVESPKKIKYAPLVQSHRYQAKVHRGRWRTDRDILESHIKAILRDFNRAVEDATK